MTDKKEDHKASFWLTLPGCITAIGGLITAVVGSYIALVVAGVVPAPFAPTATLPPPLSVTPPIFAPEEDSPLTPISNDPFAFSPTIIPTATFAPPPTVMPTEPPQNVCDRYEKVPLQLYWSEERQDNFTAAATDSINGAVSPLYYFVRTEGYIFPTPQNGTVPLELYYEGYTRFDNFTTATQAGMEEALRIGYWRVRTEGYIFSTQYPGTVPLEVYWHSGRADNFTTATNEGKTAAQAAGYQLIRTEGYICP